MDLYNYSFNDLFILCFLGIIIAVFAGALLLYILDMISYLRSKNEYKRKRFHVSELYVVGYPSGETIFLDENRVLNILREKRIVSWNSLFKCYCFNDYDKRFVEQICKFK